MSEPWLLIGLGNPGPAYASNRHNAGFMVLDALAARIGATFSSHRGRADVATGRIGATRAVLAKPRSFMNLSGGPTAAVRDFYKAPLGQVVVVHDELDLPYGTLRIKLGGGDNGHNGLRSLTQSLGSPDYLRVRLGIGRPPGRMDPAAYVLRDFDVLERRDLDVHLGRAADAVARLVTDGRVASQNAFNG